MELVNDDRLRWLLRAAAFLHEAGAEPVSGLVLPNGVCFPDAFDASHAAVQRLMERVLQHAGLADVAVDVQVVTPDGQRAGGCESGGCSAPVLKALSRRRVVPLGDRPGYAVAVSSGELGHCTGLTTGLVRAASMIFLSEAELHDEIGSGDREGFVDVAGALLGFGVLLANGSHIAHKGCSGVTVQQATALSVEELVVVLAVTCKIHGWSPKAAKAELDVAPRRSFDEAADWVDANAAIVDWVKRDRRALDADKFRFAASGGFLSRLFGGPSKVSAVPTEEELVRAASSVEVPRERSEKARRMAALRDLVDETLD